MLAGGLVHPLRVRPDSEVADVKDVIEACAELTLEGEHVGVEPIQGAMDVAGGTDEHRRFHSSMNARQGRHTQGKRAPGGSSRRPTGGCPAHGHEVESQTSSQESLD